MKAKKTLPGSFLRAAKLPAELLSGIPVVEIKGGQETSVIHHRGIAAYSEREVRILSGTGAVLICGDGLRIELMNRERIVVCGTVRSVQLGEV